ncbi:MAG TPA: maleylpyruvate isomerase family mycothiol-dependent enzyme [Lapillicoccus sp.]|nr:maleylpyruvate isomerase family mycothiol-dependent enzyme [Lapillicoccus sp.]
MDETVEWVDAQARVIALVRELDQQAAEQRVPACPDWTVRDLLSHMVGLGVDVLAGDEPNDHNATWTQRQVDQRRGRSVADLVAEWESVTEPMTAYFRERSSRPLGDLVIHEQDLRGALGVPGAQDTAGLAAIRDRMLRRFAASAAGRPPIALVGPRWGWTSGDGEPAVVVQAPDFDLARALMARRSAAQLRAWTTKGDVDAYLPAFATLGRLPERDLRE